ncbi:MAG TPA: hypothetical protein GX529_02240 [Firmicutes bacterium]|nr:hypothetical protein [Candidatus Fermentithermobacillaceae bacterium]
MRKEAVKIQLHTAISVLATVLAALVLSGLKYILTGRRRHIEARISDALGDTGESSSAIDVSDDGSETSGQARDLSQRGPKRRRLKLPAFRLRGAFMEQYMKTLKVELIKAGAPLKPEEVVGLSCCLAISGVIVGLLIFQNLTFALVLGVAGSAALRIWITLMKNKRSRLVESQLLNALVMIANSLRAGHSFMQALDLVSTELTPPLSTEFGKLARECRMGLSVEDALLNMAGRVDSKDLELAVTGVLIQRQVGGNLARVLDSIAATIDKRIKTRARIQVATAQGRISAWIVSILPFALGALVFGMYPEFGGIMFSHPLGRIMLAGGGVLLVIGVVAVRKVVNIDV